MNGFDDSESVCIVADEVEPEMHPLILQRNGSANDTCKTCIKPTSIVGIIEGPARSGRVSPLNNIKNSKYSEIGLQGENHLQLNTASNMR